MTRAAEVIAPSSNQNIVADVEQWLAARNLTATDHFEHYEDALKSVWPHIYTTNPYAGIFLAINIFLECAERHGFEVRPDFLKQAKRDNYF